MTWNSPEQIATFFNIKDNDDKDLNSLRFSLTKKMASIHPDSNGGTFSDNETEQLWHELQSAKDFIEKSIADSKSESSKNHMIPIDQVKELLGTFNQLGLQPVTTTISSLKAEARDDARSRGFIPRIGSGAFAAICTFLFAFPNSMKDNPIIGKWLENPMFQLILLVLILYSGVFFLMTWTRERRQAERVEFLSTEEGLRNTMIRLFQQRDKETEHPRRFTLRDFTKALGPSKYSANHPPISLLFGGGSISDSLADKIANLHISKLLSRGVIIETQQEGLDRTFEVSRVIFDELTEKQLS